MNILALETSTSACSVALLSQDKILSEHTIQAREHANLILTMVDTLLDQAAITLSDVNIIAYGCGPGSFTGLRIAAGVSQGLAFSYDIPIVAISSLRGLAQTAYRETNNHYIAVIQDARMSEVYWATFGLIGGVMEIIGTEALSKPEQVILDDSVNWFSIGEAWNVYQDKLLLNNAVNFSKELNYPNAKDMLVIAEFEYQRNNCIQAQDINPIYIRNNVAVKKNN